MVTFGKREEGAMAIRFNKSEIAFVNNLKKDTVLRKGGQNKGKVDIPTEESFSYILDKAKSGNEMAAVQIDEWNRFCKPRNTKEESVLNKVRKAAEEIFE